MTYNTVSFAQYIKKLEIYKVTMYKRGLDVGIQYITRLAKNGVFFGRSNPRI